MGTPAFLVLIPWLACVGVEYKQTHDDNKKQEAPDRLYWDEGLHVDGLWNILKIKIGGDVQNDTAGYANTASIESVLGNEIEGGVEWRRARVYAKGSVGKHIEFEYRYDFSGNPPKLQDAYISLVELPIPSLKFTAGRFRAPLGLEGFTGADDTVFLEKSTMTTAFFPSRNTGFFLHGDSPRHRIRWSVGALQPESDELSLKNTDNLGYSGRFAAAFHPAKHDRTLLHLGVDVWRRNVKPEIRFATRPESHIAPKFVDTGDLAARGINIASFEAAVQRGPLTIQGEYTGTKVLRSDEGGQDPFFYAFYIQASYFLSGEAARYRVERATFARPRPRREFRGVSGGRGAFELALRFSRIDLNDSEVRGGVLDNWSAAFNWYPTFHTRVMFNYILSNLDRAEPVSIFQMRLQVSF